MTSPTQAAQRERALLAAIKAEEEGPGLAGRVRQRLKLLLTPPPPPPKPPEKRGRKGPNKDWVAITASELDAMIARLDGVSSCSRMMSLSRVTFRAWKKRGQIPRKYLERFRELIASNAPSMRRRTGPIRHNARSD